MKKKLSTFAVFCLTFCILAVALSGCGGAAVDALIGNYYNDENNTEYISLDVVNTETDGIFSVHDVTIPNTSIVDVTEYNLKYVVESTNGNIKNFVVEISNVTIHGTLDMDKYVITINGKTYVKK